MPHCVHVEEKGGLAIEVIAVGADEGAHTLLQALLRAGQQHPDVQVGGRVGAELVGEREHRSDPGGVVVGARDDVGKLDVDQQEDADEKDQSGGELEQGDQAGVDAGHACEQHAGEMG